MKILCVQPRIGMGDLIIYLPYLHAISKKYSSSISVLVKNNSRAKELLSEDNHIDEIILLEKNMDGLKGALKLYKEIKKRKFDKVYIFNGSLRYKLLAKFAGIKSIYQYPLFTSKDVIFQTAKVFTEPLVGKILSTEPNLSLKVEDVSAAKNIYRINEKTKNIVLGVSASGPTKRWDIDNYIKLATNLSQYKECKFFIAVGKNDTEIIDKIKKSNINNICVTMERLPISNILPIIKNCNLYIGNDTGFMHMSAALGVKSIGIFTDSPAYSYSGYSKNIIPIVPEGETVESTTHDTLGKDSISSEKVFNTVKKILT